MTSAASTLNQNNGKNKTSPFETARGTAKRGHNGQERKMFENRLMKHGEDIFAKKKALIAASRFFLSELVDGIRGINLNYDTKEWEKMLEGKDSEWKYPAFKTLDGLKKIAMDAKKKESEGKTLIEQARSNEIEKLDLVRTEIKIMKFMKNLDIILEKSTNGEFDAKIAKCKRIFESCVFLNPKNEDDWHSAVWSALRNYGIEKKNA